MKIVHINTWSVAPGKQQALRDIMRSSKAFYARWEPNVPRTMMLSMTGSQPSGKFTMITTWDSLADWEKSMERRTTDKEWHTDVAKWMEVLLPESRELTMHEVI